MSETFATVAGVAASSVTLHLPWQGVWSADIDLADNVLSLDDPVTTLRVGDASFNGSLAPEGGLHAYERRLRLVGGAGGWGKMVSPLSYHSDGQVSARTVVQDLCAATGERLGDFSPQATRVGIDYARTQDLGSVLLQDVIGNAPWWVDAEGLTHIGPRPSPEIDPEKVTVLDWDPLAQVAMLEVEDLRDAPVGGVLAGFTDAPTLRIRSLEIKVTASQTSVKAWVGGHDASRNRLGDAVAALARQADARSLTGVYTYKVAGLAADRLNLEAVDPAAGVPNLSAVSVWAGPGISGTFRKGQLVAVMFREGRRTRPMVLGCEPVDGANHEPDALALGGKGGAPVARTGDLVSVPLPPQVPFVGVLGAAPISGVLTFAVSATGTIQGGSTKVTAK